jgi:hypothetical protein
MSMESQGNPLAEMSRDEIMSALFAQLVFQTTNATLMFLGRVPNPETQEKMLDLDAARLFIDQLEMLAVKTKGNLSTDEDRLLQQSLSHVRLAFVEAVEKQPAAPATESPAAPGSESTAAPDASAASEADEPRKRFSKKY